MSSGVDVVREPADAEGLPQPPLVVLAPLEALLDRLGIGEGPLIAQPLGDGHSNVTFLMRRGESRVVLRRPPRPPYAPSAHDVLREAAIVHGVGRAGVPAPRVLATVKSAEALGVPFVLTEHVEGFVVSSTVPDGVALPQDGHEIGEQLVCTLAAVHAIDVVDGPLASIGRHTGYLERQLRRFSTIWEEVRTRDLAEMGHLTRWLIDRMPAQQETTLVHGDFRPGNMLFDRRAGSVRLAAVLDWEMATLGDPLADLGYLCATWADPDEQENPMTALAAATLAPGFPSRRSLAARYAALTGRDVGELAWYEALALWKSAIFLEASYRRYRAGTTSDPYFARLGAGVPELVLAALART